MPPKHDKKKKYSKKPVISSPIDKFLHKDLMTEVFLWLGVKQHLLKLRLVCKSWHTFISGTPIFWAPIANTVALPYHFNAYKNCKTHFCLPALQVFVNWTSTKHWQLTSQTFVKKLPKKVLAALHFDESMFHDVDDNQVQVLQWQNKFTMDTVTCYQWSYGDGDSDYAKVLDAQCNVLVSFFNWDICAGTVNDTSFMDAMEYLYAPDRYLARKSQ